MRTNVPPRPTTTTQGAPGWAVVMVGLLVIVPTWAWDAWVGKALWNWFVSSTFHGAPRLSTPAAAGLMLVAAVFAPRPASSPQDDDPMAAIVRRLVGNLLLGAMALVAGYVLHRFV